jgi:cation diffusion facilitator family transporter
MEDKQTNENRIMIMVLTGSAILFILQLTVYFSSNILILLAGAFDSLSDILISAFLLVSIHWSSKPADEIHMFGHGRIQNVASLVIATIFILFLPIETFQAAIPKLFQPAGGDLHNINLALIVTGLAVVIYGIPLWDILRTKVRGSALKAQLYAIIEMEFAFIASFISIILVAKGFWIADPITSIFIGIIMAFTGLKLFVENAQFLIGKAPPQEFLERITVAAMSVKGVLRVHDLKAEYVGPNMVYTGFHINIANGTPIEIADSIAEEVQARVHKEPGCQFCIIHVDPEDLYFSPHGR